MHVFTDIRPFLHNFRLLNLVQDGFRFVLK